MIFVGDDCEVENVVGDGAFSRKVNVIVCVGAVTVVPLLPPQFSFPISGRSA